MRGIAFARDFTAVPTLWEFLDPHDSLDAHAADYRWLAQVYEAIKPTKVSDALLWHRLGAKTLALVHGHISNVEVAGTGLDGMEAAESRPANSAVPAASAA